MLLLCFGSDLDNFFIFVRVNLEFRLKLLLDERLSFT